MYTEAFLLQSTPRYSVDHPKYGDSSQPVDLSLFSTVLLVVALAVGGAFFIMAMACLLGEDHNTGEFPLLLSSCFRHSDCFFSIAPSGGGRGARPFMGSETKHKRVRSYVLSARATT